jgi:hypothetical protein
VGEQSPTEVQFYGPLRGLGGRASQSALELYSRFIDTSVLELTTKQPLFTAKMVHQVLLLGAGFVTRPTAVELDKAGVKVTVGKQ